MQYRKRRKLGKGHKINIGAFPAPALPATNLTPAHGSCQADAACKGTQSGEAHAALTGRMVLCVLQVVVGVRALLLGQLRRLAGGAGLQAERAGGRAGRESSR